MRRWLIGGGVAVVAIPVLWYVAARWCALAVDQVYTPRLAILENAPIGWIGMMLNDLIRIELRPAAESPVVWVETSQ
ncbi:MAG TPA: hypothetical protein VF007_06875 [Stellaceae bacterium]